MGSMMMAVLPDNNNPRKTCCCSGIVPARRSRARRPCPLKKSPTHAELNPVATNAPTTTPGAPPNTWPFTFMETVEGGSRLPGAVELVVGG